MLKAHNRTYSAPLFRLFTHAPTINGAKNQVLTQFNADPENIFYIVDGYIAVQTSDKFNGTITHAIYGPNDLVITQIYKYEVSNLFYVAITNCAYAVSPAKAVFSAATKSDLLSESLFRELMYQLQIAQDRTENLSLKYAIDRVVYRLLFYAKRFGVQDKQFIEIQLPLTHHLLASTISLSRERVSRAMFKLVGDGYISYSGKKVIIYDIDSLENLLMPAKRHIENSDHIH